MNLPLIFLTGSKGFVGSHLKKYLLKTGFTVICLNRDYAFFDQVKYKFVDFISPFIIIHCASAHQINSSTDSIMRSNLTMALDLQKIVINFTKCLGIINLSSVSIYGAPSIQLLSEHTFHFQTNLYGASKLAVEHILDSLYSYSFTRPIYHLRLPGIVGIGSLKSSNNFLSRVASSFLRNEPVSISTSDVLFNNIIDISSLLLVIHFIIDRINTTTSVLSSSYVFNIASLEPLPLPSVINILFQNLSSSSLISYTSSNSNSFSIDISLAKNAGIPLPSTTLCLKNFCRDLLST